MGSDWAVGRGLLAIRSHVDTTDPALAGVAALIEVREQVKDYIDLQLVGFPQDGYLRSPVGVENMAKALDMGVEVVGGIPHFERTMDEGDESVRQLCTLAAERGLRVDMHCDETDDTNSRHVETLAAETVRLGLEGRVTGSHLSSMHSMDNYYVSKLIPLLVEADMQVIAEIYSLLRNGARFQQLAVTLKLCEQLSNSRQIVSCRRRSPCGASLEHRP